MARKQKSEKEILLSSSAAAAAPRRKAVTATRKKHVSTQAEMPVAASVDSPAIPSASVVVTYTPTFDQIAQLAYSYWEARGYQGGSPEEDWLRAEQEVLVRVAAVTA